jgi:hypothetical protein
MYLPLRLDVGVMVEAVQMGIATTERKRLQQQ